MCLCWFTWQTVCGTDGPLESNPLWADRSQMWSPPHPSEMLHRAEPVVSAYLLTSFTFMHLVNTFIHFYKWLALHLRFSFMHSLVNKHIHVASTMLYCLSYYFSCDMIYYLNDIAIVPLLHHSIHSNLFS